MARITTNDVSNFDESKELATITQQGRPVHWPPVKRVSLTPPGEREMLSDQQPADVVEEEVEQIKLAEPDELDKQIIEEGGEDPSAGINSSTSESKPEQSGSQPQGTQASRQSPVPDAESPSSPDQPTKPQPSSAPSTSGSGQGTGSGQARPSDSSAELAAASPATRGTGEEDPETGGFAVGGPVE